MQKNEAEEVRRRADRRVRCRDRREETHTEEKRRGIVDVVSAAVLTASKLKGETEF